MPPVCRKASPSWVAAATLALVPPRIRAVAALACLVYVAFLAMVLTQPQPTVAEGVVGGVARWLDGLGLPAWATEGSRVEFVLNAGMFAPAVLLAAVALPRHPWANWVVYGFVASGAVELCQGLFLSARTAQMVDVVANTLGALAGAVVSVPVIRVLERRGR